MTRRAGNYYVWHCEWCDSTNYTEWTRLAADGLACGACHHQAGASAEDYPVSIPSAVSTAAGLNNWQNLGGAVTEL
jgi:hypothetical protein